MKAYEAFSVLFVFDFNDDFFGTGQTELNQII